MIDVHSRCFFLWTFPFFSLSFSLSLAIASLFFHLMYQLNNKKNKIKNLRKVSHGSRERPQNELVHEVWFHRFYFFFFSLKNTNIFLLSFLFRFSQWRWLFSFRVALRTPQPTGSCLVRCFFPRVHSLVKPNGFRSLTFFFFFSFLLFDLLILLFSFLIFDFFFFFLSFILITDSFSSPWAFIIRFCIRSCWFFPGATYGFDFDFDFFIDYFFFCDFRR